MAVGWAWPGVWQTIQTNYSGGYCTAGAGGRGAAAEGEGGLGLATSFLAGARIA